MVVVVIDGKFHKNYDRGLLGNFPQNKKKQVEENSIYFGHLVHSQEHSTVLNSEYQNSNFFFNYFNLFLFFFTINIVSRRWLNTIIMARCRVFRLLVGLLVGNKQSTAILVEVP